MKLETLENILLKTLKTKRKAKIHVIDFFNKQRTDFFTGYANEFKIKRGKIDIITLHPYAGFYVETGRTYGYAMEGRKAYYKHLILNRTNIITLNSLTHQKQTQAIINKWLDRITNESVIWNWSEKYKKEQMTQTTSEFKKYLKISKKI